MLGVALDTSRSLGKTVTGRVLRPLLTVDHDTVELATVGRAVDAAGWAESKARAARLDAETRRIADALERGGYPAYRQDRQLVRICGVTLAEEVLPTAFRHIKILPAVQVADTSATRRELMSFVAGHDLCMQMLVLSAGWVPADQVRKAISALGRRVSKIAKHLRDAWSADLFFRNIEMTYHRDAAGRLMVHVHSHAFIDHPYFAPDVYKQFRNDIRSRAPKGYAHLSVVKKDAIAEAVKYPFQPEKAGGTELTDLEWVTIAEQVEGLRFFVPLGGFKAWRADLRPADGPRSKLVVVDCMDGPLVYAKPGVKSGKRDPSTGFSQDVIVNVLRPSPRFSNRATPAIMISDRSQLPLLALLEREGFGPLIDRWRAMFNARAPLSERVPVFDRASLVSAARRGLRHEVHGGRDYLVSERVEQFDRRAAAQVMRHTTTTTVRAGPRGKGPPGRSKAPATAPP